MTKRKKKFLSSYAVANALAYDVPDAKPPASAPKDVKVRARRGLMTFYCAVSRGTAPAPDASRGTTNLWDAEKFEAYLESLEKKKPDARSSAHQAKTATPQRATEAVRMPRRNRPVKDENGEVRHG